MIGSSVLLGAAFIAVGYLVSALVRDRGTAGGIAVGIWLVFVLIYDMALLGLLVVDQGQTVSGGRARRAAPAQPGRRLPPVQPDRLRQRELVLRHGRARADSTTLSPPSCSRRSPPGPSCRWRWRRSRFPGESYEKGRLPAAYRWSRCWRSPAATTRRRPKPPPPHELRTSAIGHYCGMNVLEHPGPKGQIILASRKEPVWFSSARDTISFTMLPEEPKDIRAIYVSDMAQGAELGASPARTTGSTRSRPGSSIGSRMQGRHGRRRGGAVLRQGAADRFAAENGGRVVAFAEVPRDYVLGAGTAS